MLDVALASISDAYKFRVQSWKPGEPNVNSLSQVIGAEWPLTVGSVSEGRCRVLCIGPTDWTVVVSSTAAPQVHSSLQSLAASTGVSVVETTDALAAICVQGTTVRDLLSQGCGIDLHPRAFPPGMCARARFAHVPIILHCVEDSRFDYYISRSYQPHLASWFAGAGVTLAS